MVCLSAKFKIMLSQNQYLQVALGTSRRRSFTYLPPVRIPQYQALIPGIRLQVPLGNRQVVGILLKVSNHCDIVATKLKAATALIDLQPVLPEGLFQLGLWACRYYQYPVGDGLLHMLPTKLRQAQRNQPVSSHWQRLDDSIALTAAAILQRSPKQAAIWHQLKELPVIFNQQQLKRVGLTPGALKGLLQKGLLKTLLQPTTAPEPKLAQDALVLNPEQTRALQCISPMSQHFRCTLLQGVTGSGKTEIYLQAITQCLSQGRRALILVPEIGLTPQTLQQLQARFDNTIICLHSGLTDKQRLDGWQQANLGFADIVVGTRSAIFTPIPQLGLIVVDEEHDLAYKQQDGLRYHARDLAVKRAYDEAIPIILGSATPALESLANVERGRFQHAVLPKRAGPAQQQRYQIIDVCNEVLSGGLSTELLLHIEQHLRANQQVLLFLNRRGFAPSLQCHNCGLTITCPQCDASLTLHQEPARLHCHHCDHKQAVICQCPYCHNQNLQAIGVGTERCEAQLNKQFPTVPVLRIDSDSTRGKHKLPQLLAEILTGQPCILLGTQMLTKGHHFPSVTLVGLLDLDASLFSTDFRGPERLAQQVVQAAGRAGRANQPGLALLQTRQGEHPYIQILTQRGYAEFACYELQRRRQAQLPPYTHMAIFRAEAKLAQSAEQCLTHLQKALDDLPEAGEQLRAIGPIPASMLRRNGRYRYQLLLQHPQRQALQTICSKLCLLAEQKQLHKVRWSLDIDPQEIM